MGEHRSEIQEWKSRQRRQKPAETPAGPPVETKGLQDDGGRGRAARTGGVESRIPALPRSGSNIARLREPLQNRATRSGRFISTETVECTPPASPDHLKHRFLVPHRKVPKSLPLILSFPGQRSSPLHGASHFSILLREPSGRMLITRTWLDSIRPSF